MNFSTENTYLIIRIIEVLFILYAAPLSVIYLLRIINAFYTNIRYKNIVDNEKKEIEILTKTPLATGISIIAPAYNESSTIIDNIRSLLMIDYPTFEVIIVNDGSQDDSISKVVSAFDLERTAKTPINPINSRQIKSIYKSNKHAFRRLTIIDKANGGKADALNAGLQYAKYPLIASIDVDSILTKNALAKLARPFMQDSSVIASGSAIRIANSCEIEHGFLKKVYFPKGFYARFQVLEYLRAFLLGRMLLSNINGLMLVSGATGLFKKHLVTKVGGYSTDTVGEDIELLIRMRRYCYENGIKHKVKYISDPICYTEAPSDTKTLKRQRNRWARGSIEALWRHKKMLFNPGYGVIGMYSLPYWLFYELLLPVILVAGIIFVSLLILMGLFSPIGFLKIYLFSYSFSVFISMSTLLLEEFTYRQYSRVSDFFTLTLLALSEAFVYQPLVAVWSLSGILDKIIGKKRGWGVMKRNGFTKTARI